MITLFINTFLYISLIPRSPILTIFFQLLIIPFPEENLKIEN